MVFHRVNSHSVLHEDFVGLYVTDLITSNAIVVLIKDVLLWMNLKLENCRG